MLVQGIQPRDRDRLFLRFILLYLDEEAQDKEDEFTSLPVITSYMTLAFYFVFHCVSRTEDVIP